MTMHIVFQQDKDGYKKDWSGFVEVTLARRFCENGIAIPYQRHLDNIYDAEQAEKKDKAAKAEKLKKDKAAKAENATSKKAEKKEKAVKK